MRNDKRICTSDVKERTFVETRKRRNIFISAMGGVTLRKEEREYLPYKYSLTGKKVGTNETWSRRYRSMEEAFLHIVNDLNENVVIKNKYNNLEEWLSEK